MKDYRTHKCGEISAKDLKQNIRVGGFLHNKRDHGSLLFLDIRDHYGIIQVVATNLEMIEKISKVKLESVLLIEGKVRERKEGAVNKDLSTGQLEIEALNIEIESESEQIPFSVNNNLEEINEEIRLKFRFLDLRREKMKRNLLLRSQVISEIRKQMENAGFIEFQTPILTASSPEGARDFLVPSRVHPGKFYALPQAPQQFKQLLMVAGFDKYFQIAPCFRDEDARADRSPGEFYQLDIEMAFVNQEDIFNIMEPILYNLFVKFSGNKEVSPFPFKRIPYNVSMLKYGVDKPDLRNPIINFDATPIFEKSEFKTFSSLIEKGNVVRGIPAPGSASKPRKFFDDLNEFARNNGASGLGYIIFNDHGEPSGPIAKFLTPEKIELLMQVGNIKKGDAIFFSCNIEEKANKLAGQVRIKLAQELNLIDKNKFEFCWVVDFPFYERNEETGNIEFSHNPFSMPQGGIEALLNEDPLKINAFQYDIVCNGIELSSGAIRNHRLDIMYKAFEIAGYSRAEVESKFAGLVKAFSYGAPPHGGFAPGIDRMVMLLAQTDSIRDIIAFPLTSKAEDLLMNAPSVVPSKQLNELHIKTILPNNDKNHA